MKNFYKIILILSIFTLKANAQQIMWQRYYTYSNTNTITDVIQTFDGGYIMVGGISTPPNVSIHLIRTNYLGLKLWEKIINDTSDNISALSIKQTSDSGYIMTGQIGSDLYILKTDKNGNYLWRKSYNHGGDAIGYNINVTDDLGFIVGGEISFISENSSKSYIMKTDSIGNLEWQQLYGDSVFTSGANILPVNNSQYNFTNVTKRNSSSESVGVCYKIDSLGKIIWKSPIGANRGGLPILHKIDEGLYVCGQFFIPPFTYNLYMCKFDDWGNMLWQQSYDSTLALQNVCYDKEFNFIFGGYKSINLNYDYAVIKIDVNGNYLFSKTINTPENYDNFCSNFRLSNDNGYIFVGNTNFGKSFGFGNNILAVKTDSQFNTTPIVNINHLSSQPQTDFILFQNYPNPFNPKTIINYQITLVSHISLKVYDAIGNEIKTLVDKIQNAGSYTIEFSGNNLSSGIYFYKLQSEYFTETKKMILLR